MEYYYGTIGSVGVAAYPKLTRFRSGSIGDGLTEPTVNVQVSFNDVIISSSHLLVPGSVHDLGGGAGTGVTYVFTGTTLPAGVTLTDGRLTYTAPAA